MSASLDNIVDVSVSVSNPTTIQSSFNLGCIIGPSTALASTRAKVYRASNFETQMVTDGFKTTDPEYIAASLYFSQSEPSSQLVVGYHNNTGSTETPRFRLLLPPLMLLLRRCCSSIRRMMLTAWLTARRTSSKL